MKKNYLLIAAGLLGAASLQAQTVVASLDFEDESQKGAFKTEYALTPELGFFGDWVNYKDTDEWDERSQDDPHSGEYCFMAANTGAIGQTWDRGFKLSFPMKVETPYRVSFWAKVDPSYQGSDAGGGRTLESTELTSWLSKGMENYDKSILSYGMDHKNGPRDGVLFNGEWQHVSYVVYNPTAEAMDATIPSWQGGGVFPARFGGQDGETYRSHFEEKLPEVYFFIANLFCPVTYYLDDIVIEEGVTVREVTYSDEIIKVDFGYATNIATLAKANKGTLSLDKDLVTVTINGEEAEVVYVEGKEDGFLYINVAAQMFEDDEVVVSFKGSEEMLYSSANRPSSDTTGNVQVFGFKDEKAYWDETVETVFAAWGKPTMKSSVPVNNSFNLKAEDVKEVTVNFVSAVNIKNASAVLIKGAQKTSLTSAMQLSEDKKTITIPVSGLTDGAYKLVIENLKNENDEYADEPAEVNFEIGAPSGNADEEIAYVSDYGNYDASTLPIGYSGTSDNSDRESTAAEPLTGLAGAPRMMGTPDNSNHGIYWGARGGSTGILSFGKYAALSASGETLGDGITPEEALWLDEGTYVLTYKNASWDAASGNAYKVGIYDAAGTSIFLQEGLVPEITIAQGPAEGVIPTSEYEVAVPAPGYYYIEFEGNTGWSCWLLTSLSITGKPASSGAAAMKKLKDAIETAQMNLNGADEKYDGTAKTALAEVIKKAQEGTYTNPQEVTEMVKELSAASQKLAERKANYDNFVKKLADAQSSIETLEGKYKTNAKVKDAEAIIKKYDGVDPKGFSDSELAAASKDVDGVPGILNNIKTIVDVLTFRATQASELALKLNVDDAVIDALDALADDATPDIEAANKHITLALYNAIASGEDLEPLKEKKYSSEVDENFDETDEESVATHDADGHKLILSGIPASGYVRNPNFYTTKAIEALGDNTFNGWMCTQNEDGFAKQNTGASESSPAVDAMMQSYGENVEYDLYQVISDLPVGVYTLLINSRVASSFEYDVDDDGTPETYEYNGLNEETGLWDKYIYAQVGDGELQTTKFAIGGYGEVRPTYVTEVVVKEGQSVRIGAVEKYTSGKALINSKGEPRDFWDTTTYIDTARLYFTAPLEGYDYAAAAQKLAQEIATDIETVEAAPAKQNGALFNLAGQQVDENYKGIVVTADGKKFLQK
jgi:hypothetical protein